MDLILSIIGILVVVAIAFVIARFLLRLTGRVIGCILTAIVALGIAQYRMPSDQSLRSTLSSKSIRMTHGAC